MATILSSVLMERLDIKSVPKSKRKLQKHLRSSGQAYISRTGKLIPAKEVADELCQCPHKCDSSVPWESRLRLFEHFYGLGDADAQNRYLRQHMDLRARLNIPEPPSTASGTTRPPRRITCKYLVPILPGSGTVEVCQKAFVSAFVITTKRVRLQREKLISSLGLNSYSSHNRSKNNNNVNTKNYNKSNISIETKNFINNNNRQISLLKHSLQQAASYQPMDFEFVETKDFNKQQMSLLKHTLEKPFQPMELDIKTEIKTEDISEAPSKTKIKTEDISETPSTDYDGPINARYNNPLLPFGLLLPEGITIVPVSTPDHARDIAIVNNFFSNQLWKPEYIGAS